MWPQKQGTRKIRSVTFMSANYTYMSISLNAGCDPFGLLCAVRLLLACFLLCKLPRGNTAGWKTDETTGKNRVHHGGKVVSTRVKKSGERGSQGGRLIERSKGRESILSPNEKSRPSASWPALCSSDGK